jgi:hypothetical protein
VRKILLLAASVWFLACAACSGVREPILEKSPGATVASGKQILVMLKESPVRHYRPGPGLFRDYASAPAATREMQIARELALKYGFVMISNWPMPSIGVRCFLGEIKADENPEEIAARIASDMRVESVQTVQLFHTLGHNDPLYSLQSSARLLRLDELHRMATGKQVRIAQVDTGVDVGHPDLKGQISDAKNFVDGSDYVAESHGTAVAGIIVAKADNRIGIVGVAPDATLLALRACWQNPADTDGAVCSSFTLAKAIQYAILRHANVLNLSLAGPRDRILERLIDQAIENGMSVVGAIDPDFPSNSFPASHVGVLAVAVAGTPGRGSMAIYAPGDHVLTTTPDAGWGFVSGSSFAAAHVTGIAALLLEISPALKPADIHAMLHEHMAGETLAAGGTILNACSLLASVWRKPDCPCCGVITNRRMRYEVGKRSS